MPSFFLDEPKYEVLPGDILMLTLKNNIIMRSKRKTENLLKNNKISEIWSSLNEFEKDVVMFIADRGEANTSELVKYTGRSKSTILRLLNKLEREDIICWYGSNITDPKRKILLK